MMEWLLFRLFRRSILVRLLFIIGCLVSAFRHAYTFPRAANVWECV